MVKYKYFLWHMEETSASYICTSTSTHSCSGSRSSGSSSISCCISSNPCINISIPEHLMILLSDWLTAVLPLTCRAAALQFKLHTLTWLDGLCSAAVMTANPLTACCAQVELPVSSLWLWSDVMSGLIAVSWHSNTRLPRILPSTLLSCYFILI